MAVVWEVHSLLGVYSVPRWAAVSAATLYKTKGAQNNSWRRFFLASDTVPRSCEILESVFTPYIHTLSSVSEASDSRQHTRLEELGSRGGGQGAPFDSPTPVSAQNTARKEA